MACFLVSAAEAAVVKAVEKNLEKKEAEQVNGMKEMDKSDIVIPFATKLNWLTRMLCGGSALLAFEHVWHGEVVPWFPFLTAMANPADKMEMLHEMGTVGVGMALLVTAVWGVMCRVADIIVRRPMVMPKKI